MLPIITPPDAPISEEAQTELIRHIGNLVIEASTARSEWDGLVVQNRNLYNTGTTHGQPADDEMIVHEIQCSVNAAVVVQMREPLQPKIEGVETGEPAVYYWSAPDEVQYVGIEVGLPPECVAEWVSNPEDPAAPLNAPMPIGLMQAEALQATAMSKELAPVLPPGFIRPDWIFELDDRNCADVLQTVYDVIRRRSGVNLWVRKNLHQTNIEGTGWGLYEFDPVEKKHLLKTLPFKSVHIDPLCADISGANYAGFDMVYDADEARASFPTLTAIVDQEAHTGPPRQLGGETTTDWSGEHDIDFKREIIEFRVFWLRHQTAWMSEEEAVESGEVVQQEVVDDQGMAGFGPDETEGGLLGVGVGDGGTSPLPGDGELGRDDGIDPADAGPAVGEAPAIDDATAPSPAPTRLAFILPDTGAEVTPFAPGWPTVPAVRQVIIIGRTVVDDRVSEFGADGIPILHNVNMSTAQASPYGIGEPYRLRNLQNAMSGVLGAMCKNAQFFAHPMVTTSSSMASLLPANVRATGRAVPGMMIEVPDDQWIAMGGKVDAVIDPPPMPAMLVELFPILKSTMDQQSGHTPTMRGTAPSANASGKMIELLQDSGAAMMEARAERMANMVERLAMLEVHSIVHLMSPEDVFKIYSKLPLHVLYAVCERWKQIEWNAVVDVSAMVGAARQAKTQNAMALYQSMLISKQSAQERAGIESRVEDKRQEAELQKQMRMQQTMPVEGEGGEKEGGKKKEQGNGQQQQQPAA